MTNWQGWVLCRYKAVSRRQPGSSYVPSPPGSQFRQLRSPLGVFWQDIAETSVSFPASSSSSADLEASTTSGSISSGGDASSSGSTADTAAEGAAHAEAATAGNRSSVSVASQDQHGEHGDRWPFRRTHVDPGSTASHLSYGKLLSAYKHRWERSATGTHAPCHFCDNVLALASNLVETLKLSHLKPISTCLLDTVAALCNLELGYSIGKSRMWRSTKLMSCSSRLLLLHSDRSLPHLRSKRQ